jgi:hypothetical protein
MLVQRRKILWNLYAFTGNNRLVGLRLIARHTNIVLAASPEACQQ